MHNPTPNGMEIDVIGHNPAASKFIATAKQASNDSEFTIKQVATVDEAKSRITTLDARAAIDPATNTLYTAKAGNATATSAAQTYVTAIATASGQQVTVEDLAPLPSSDAVGTGVMYVGLGAMIGGFLTTTTASIVAPRIRIRTKIVVLAFMSIAAAAVQILISYGITGTLHGNMWNVAAMSAALAFTCGIINLAGFTLFGPIQLVISIGLFIFLGVPASGVPIGIDMTSSFFQFLHPYLPTSAAFDGLKRIVYFDSNGLWPRYVTLGVWTAVAGIGLLIAHKRRAQAVSDYYAVKSKESATADT